VAVIRVGKQSGAAASDENAGWSVGDGQEIVPTSAAGAAPATDGATASGGSEALALGWIVPRVISQARRLPLDTWLVLAVAVVALALRLRPLGAPSTEYDEGVYWQSLRAMALGHPLFSEVFSSQPPLFLLAIYPFYLLFGSSLVAARTAVVMYSLVSLLAIYAAGRIIGGRWVGLGALALLALDPLYLRGSHTLQAEIPALAFAVTSVALAASAVRQSGGRRRGLAGTAGLTLALGCGVKLFDIAALAPVVVYLLAPVGLALTDAEGAVRWPGARAVGRALGVALPDLLACSAGAVAGLALVFLPFAGQWPALYDQVVRFHLAAARTSPAGTRTNIALLAHTTSELPLELLAVVAAAVALATRRWCMLAPALWACAACIILVRQQPLFGHHEALLIPPLALTAAVGLPDLADALPAIVGMGGRLARRPLVIALAGAVLVWSVGTIAIQAAAPISASSCQDAVVAQALADRTQPGDLVVADDQYIVALAGRDVPPQLVDTSLVRVQSGYLTAAQLERAVQDPNVRAILFCSGRFDLVPGFRAWVAVNYVAVGAFGSRGALYLKWPRALNPV
jgi:hypothetical protein